jgi:predicted PurR-regulated permease PerM
MPRAYASGQVANIPAMAETRQGSVMHRALPLYVALLLALLTAVGLIALARLEHVLLILFISVLFAAALSGPTERLERVRVPRAVAVPFIYLAALALAVGLVWLVTPPLFDEIADFGEAAPGYVERYESVRETYEELRERYPALGPFDERVAELGETIAARAGKRAFDLPTVLFGLFLDLLSIFVISTLLVSNRERILAAILELVHPSDRPKTRDVLVKMWTRIGFYLRAKVIVMAIVGGITYGALLMIGVPFALPLAIIVALGEAIPRAGPWLARIPLLAIAALDGLGTLGITFAASVVIENLKGYVISPVVEGDQLDIHPLVVFVSVLVGGALLGVAGAFVAVPAAAMVQVLHEEVVRPWRLAQLQPPA